MIGVADGVDHVLDAGRADARGKIDDLLRLGRKGQRIDQDAAVRRHHQAGIDFDIELTGKYPGVVGNTCTCNSHTDLLCCVECAKQ